MHFRLDRWNVDFIVQRCDTVGGWASGQDAGLATVAGSIGADFHRAMVATAQEKNAS